MTEKSALRRRCIEERKNIPADTFDKKVKAVTAKLFSSDEYKSAGLILSFVSVENEFPTREIIEHSLSLGKKVAVPFIENGKMEFKFISSLLDLVPGAYNIPTSHGETVTVFDNAFCVTPALCTDYSFYRLGYGGGYYDRFINEHAGVFYTVPCFGDFIFDEIPHNTYDQKVDCIISEKSIGRRCV